MVDRESMIEQSIAEFAKAALIAKNYDKRKWELVEAFPSNIVKLDRILIAVGFSFDDGGEQGECGSDYRHRLYTIEFWVFGRTNTQARNVANVLKFACESGDYNGSIPLLDIAQTPAMEIDRLIVTKAHAAHQRFQEPEPWQEHVWTTSLTVEDWYFSHAA